MKPDAQAVFASLRRQAEDVKAEWARRGRPDARAALAEHPDLAADRSLVLDLAYEEYCLRKEAGEDVDPEDFCARFPVYRTSVRRLIGAHELFEGNPQLLDEAPRWPTAGESFGDYTLLRELGRGAFARAFLALERSTGDRPVVVKLSAEGGAEARTLGRLAHPHVVPVLSAHREAGAGLTAVCMPYLGNATLHDLLDRAFPAPDSPPPRRARVLLEAIQATAHPADPAVEPPPPPPSRWLLRGRYVDGVVHLAAQMAEALAFLHGRQVTHRDLKPSNVLLSPDGRALLLDFNLSAAGDVSDTRLGGTLPYMAPEQVEAFLRAGRKTEDGRRKTADEVSSLPSSVDARCDLFSLGVIVYELLTGVHPYGPVPLTMPPEQLARWLLERQRGGHTPLRRLNLAVDPAVARVVEKCLAPNPAQRPASAEVADALKAHLDRRLRPRRWLARLPLLLLLVGCLLLPIAYAAGWVRQTVEVPVEQPIDPAEEYRLGVQAFNSGKGALRPDQVFHGESERKKAVESALAHFQQAEAHFERGIVAGPPEFKFFFARGHARFAKARLGQSNWLDAHADFQRAYDLRLPYEDPVCRFCMAYCLTRADRHPEAISDYDWVIKRGYNEAAARNNRAFSCLKRRLTAQDFKEAEQDLERAIGLDPDLLPPRYNRALLAYYRHLMAPPNELVLNGTAVADIRYVLDRSPARTRELYSDAATLYVHAILARVPLSLPTGNGHADLVRLGPRCTLPEPPSPALAAECVERAIAEGQPPTTFARDPFFQQSLGGQPAYEQLLRLQPGTRSTPPGAHVGARLVEPELQLPD
jgi:serine/threonine protein kinase